MIASQKIVQRDTQEFLGTFRNTGIVDTMNTAPTNISNKYMKKFKKYVVADPCTACLKEKYSKRRIE